MGTVSHIIAAEDEGPRADTSVDPEERRKFENLVLFCATHGREVDDSETGEVRFPVEELRRIKQLHEDKFADVVDRMLASATTQGSAFADIADAGPRASFNFAHAERYLVVLDFKDYEDYNELVPAQLEVCRQRLVSLSQFGLDTLQMLIALWEGTIESEDGVPQYFRSQSAIQESLVMNRVRSRRVFVEFLAELEKRDLLYFPHDEVEDREYREFVLRAPWTDYSEAPDSPTSWNSIGTFLNTVGIGSIASWIPSLDFSVFD